MKLEKPREITLPTGVLGLAASPDGGRLYASCMDGHVYTVDPASGNSESFAGTHTSFASGCVALPDGKTVISAGYDGCLLWHDVETKRSFRRVKAHDFWSWQLALSPDGKHVASVTGQYLVGGEKYEPAPSAEPTMKVFDTAHGNVVREFTHLPPVLSVAFSPDGRLVGAANMMGEVRVWDIAEGKVAAEFTSRDFTSWGIIKSPHYCGGIYGLAFAPDGNSLLCCGMGPMADPMAGNGKMTWQRWAWRESPPKMIEQIRDGERGAGLMETLAHSPVDKTFLMAGRQAQGTWTTALFSSEDGRLLSSLDTKSRVTRALFSADGRTLYLAAALGQPNRDKAGKWPSYGRIHVVPITV
jgi:WD40 repeat protein